MGLSVTIAWRNILRHQGKSVVIGTILCLGAFLMTVGNGMVGGMERGLQRNIVHGFTGHVVLVAEEQESDNVFIEFMGKAVEPIYNYPDIREALRQLPYVRAFLPVGKNGAMILNDEDGAPGFAFLLGVEIDAYRRMFPNSMTVVEGADMEPGAAGVLIAAGARKEYFATTALYYTPEGFAPDTALMPAEAKALWPDRLLEKDHIVFMGMNNDNTTTDVRVPVKGIVTFRALNNVWGQFTLLDIESYRRCLGYFAAADMEAVVTDAQQSLLQMDAASLDELFGSDASELQLQEVVAAAASADDETTVVDIEAGIYNLVLLHLQDDLTPEQGALRLNRDLADAGVRVRAVPWRRATGMIGSMTQIIKGSLFLFVMLLFVVAIIIIVNTLSMAALERSGEIGMMRAIGARKGFVRRMFLAETAILSFVCGGLGVVLGLAVVQLLPLLNIASDNDMVQLLFGGDRLHPVLLPRDIVAVLLQLSVVCVLAVLYPLHVAGSITPLDAIARE